MFKKIVLTSILVVVCFASSFAEAPVLPGKPMADWPSIVEPVREEPDLRVILFLNANGTINEIIFDDDGVDCVNFVVFVGSSPSPVGGGSNCP